MLDCSDEDIQAALQAARPVFRYASLHGLASPVDEVDDMASPINVAFAQHRHHMTSSREDSLASTQRAAARDLAINNKKRKAMPADLVALEATRDELDQRIDTDQPWATAACLHALRAKRAKLERTIQRKRKELVDIIASGEGAAAGMGD